MKIAVIMPTRSANGKRGPSAKEAFDSWKETRTTSDFFYGVDEDDVANYKIPTDAKTIMMPRMKLVPKLNDMCGCLIAQNTYTHVLFIGDDHRFRTSDWESMAEDKTQIAYGNDLLQGEKLPTAVLVSLDIVNALGYMCPPIIEHMYADNFWLDLGRECSIIKYHPEVVIEHMHFSIGKSAPDQQYFEVAKLHQKDQIAYESYKNTTFQDDVRKVREICASGLLEQDFTE